MTYKTYKAQLKIWGLLSYLCCWSYRMTNTIFFDDIFYYCGKRLQKKKKQIKQYHNKAVWQYSCESQKFKNCILSWMLCLRFTCFVIGKVIVHSFLQIPFYTCAMKVSLHTNLWSFCNKFILDCNEVWHHFCLMRWWFYCH